MTMFEYSGDSHEKQACIPERVLKGIKDVADGRTLSDEEFDEVIDF